MMKPFKDNKNREWVITINVWAVKRCRALAEVDLYGLVDDGFKGLGALLKDPIKLVDVIYVLCKDDADEKGITDEDFGRAMAGDAVGAATDAFLAEFTDFFPDPRVRAGIKKMIETGRRVTDRMMELGAAELDQIDVDSVVAKLIASSGNSPESSESTPVLSPSANST